MEQQLRHEIVTLRSEFEDRIRQIIEHHGRTQSSLDSLTEHHGRTQAALDALQRNRRMCLALSLRDTQAITLGRPSLVEQARIK